MIKHISNKCKLDQQMNKVPLNSFVLNVRLRGLLIDDIMHTLYTINQIGA